MVLTIYQREMATQTIPHCHRAILDIAGIMEAETSAYELKMSALTARLDECNETIERLSSKLKED